jgi:urease accessory protein
MELALTRSSTGSSRNCSSRLERVGREGLLDLAFVRRGELTILARRRFTHPLQALEPVRASDGTLYLMMLNTSGGMVGGDHLRTTVDIGADAEVALITASANKAYRSMGPATIQESSVHIRRGATLEYLPDHLIPHPGSIVHQSLRVEMESRSRAIIYDAIAAGRIGRGERWNFAELRAETTITRESRPLYINRARIIPASQALNELGWAQDFNYLASFVIVGDSAPDGTAYRWSSLSDALDAALRYCGAYGGVSQLERYGGIVRFMAHSASDLSRTTQTLWGVARRFLLRREAFAWRKF